MDKELQLSKPDSVSIETLEDIVIRGDLKGLSPIQRVAYVRKLCDHAKISFVTNPFSFIEFQGKVKLYVNRSATDALRANNEISVKIVSREDRNGVLVVTAQATTPKGRTDESIGAVSIKGKERDDLANAWMKAETKAKRRVTLSICGLGLLDESELDTMHGARPLKHDEVVADKPKEVSAPRDVSPPTANQRYVVDILGSKYKGLHIDEIPENELMEYCDLLDQEYKRMGKVPGGKVAEFLKKAGEILAMAMQSEREINEPNF